MSEWTFWLIAIAVGVFLWWLAYVATARMRHGNNQEREEQAKRNLEWLAQQKAENQQAENAPADNPQVEMQEASKQEKIEASKKEDG